MNDTYTTATGLPIFPTNLHPSAVEEWNPDLARRIAAGRVVGATFPIPNATGDPDRCAADQCDEIRRRLFIARNATRPEPYALACCTSSIGPVCGHKSIRVAMPHPDMSPIIITTQGPA